MKPSVSALVRPAYAMRSRGLVARLRAWLLDEVTAEEARQRLQGKPGYFASLSPEAVEYMRNYDGPEVHGPPLTKRERRDLARRMAAREQK
jgi:hypothetical protein